jgi:DNA-binding SARP family transcriptional activator/tetratricopeptide (TPR) repeat protein
LARLSLSFLGGFNVLLDGQPVTAFSTDKVRALLAYLVVEAARPHRRGALAGMLWPEMPEARAAHNLRQSLLRLRRALHEDEVVAAGRPPFLLLTRRDVQLNLLADCQLDVADFQELIHAYRQHRHPPGEGCEVCVGWLRQAVDLYRGDLLAGFALRDSVPFEEWQLVWQEALHGQALEALGLLADYYERLGEPAQVLEYARRLVVLEPWQERAQMQLMAAMAQCDQETAALEQYTSYARTLAQEFGIAPSPEAAALHEQIRARDLSRRDAQGAGAGASEEVQDVRRQVTALLCQWQIPVSDDPEVMQEGLLRFGDTVTRLSQRHGGHPQPRHGSEFLVYFGYPVAREDSARSAVSAALALVAALHEREHVRIGIHTGMMVSHDADLVGKVPDVARDCMRLAEPDSVMITADTECLVRDWFSCQPMSVPGSAQGSLVYRVLGESADHRRSVWGAQGRQTPRLVGREDELRQLAACIDRVRMGHGQIVAVYGEPGIGKTRLTRAFKQMCSWPATWVESHCSLLYQNTSLYPIIDLLQQLLQFEPGDDLAVKREKLAGGLARLELSSPTTQWLISVLLGLPTDTPAPRTVTEDQRERMREACLALLLREAARQPVMLLIEDLQWADPTTIAWLSRSLDALAASRCLLWLNWRPEFVAPWPPRPHQITLNLGPVSPQQSADLVSAVAGEGTLPEAVRQQVVKQADGIPLYIEELTHTLLDRTASESADGQESLPIPATLRDSLTARFDRTGPARETALWAAALGREFSYPVLRAVVPYDERRMNDDLAALVAAGLIREPDAEADAIYTFRHALMQEAVYGTLLRRTRRSYHRRIAETLTADFPALTETQPEIPAWHYSQAGIPAKAADYWILAGERAMAQGATLEARTCFDRALAEVGPGDHERRWRALMGREAVLGLRGERAAQREGVAALLELAEALDDNTRRAQALLRQAEHANRLDQFQLVLCASEAAITAATRAGNAALEVLASSRRVVALARLERWDEARRRVEEILARLPEIADDLVRGNVIAALALYYSDLGDVARALVLRLEGLEIARRAGDRALQSRHLANVGFAYWQLGLYDDARAAHEAGLALAEAVGDRYWQITHWFDLSYVFWCSGDRERAEALGQRALHELRRAANRSLGLATCLGYLGLIHEDAGDYAGAAAYLVESRILFARAGLNGPSKEVQAVEARCVLALGRREEARQLATEVWAHLRANGTSTIDFPSRVYVCLADVVSQVETPGISAHEVIEAGYRELMRRADLIRDPEWRRSFLENELSNRALLARWRSG